MIVAVGMGQGMVFYNLNILRYLNLTAPYD